MTEPGVAGSGPAVPDAVEHAVPSSPIAGEDGPEGLGADALDRRWGLVLPYRQQMIRLARRRGTTAEDAEDVVSTAMLRTVEHLGLDERQVARFLSTTVMRLAVDVHRKQARRLAAEAREASRTAIAVPAVDEAVCDQDEARWLSEQLGDLPERERQVLEARLSGLTVEQTGQRLGLTVKAVENAYTRLRRRARAALASTLAGIGVLVGAGRRAARPELTLLPVAASALLAAVIVQGASPPAGPDPGRAVVVGGDARPVRTAPALPTVAGGTAPGPAQLSPAGPPPVDRTGSDRAGPLTPGEPQPTRTVLRPPAVVSPEVIDAGGVYVQERDTGRTFEEEVRHCVDNVVRDPLADFCQ